MERINDDMLIVVICQEYGWTYEQYMSQPFWFIRLVQEKMSRDSKERNRANKKAGGSRW